jgi:hypothetical protein
MVRSHPFDRPRTEGIIGAEKAQDEAAWRLMIRDAIQPPENMLWRGDNKRQRRKRKSHNAHYVKSPVRKARRFCRRGALLREAPGRQATAPWRGFRCCAQGRRPAQISLPANWRRPALVGCLGRDRDRSLFSPWFWVASAAVNPPVDETGVASVQPAKPLSTRRFTCKRSPAGA